MTRNEWAAGLPSVDWLDGTQERAWQGQVIVMGLVFAQIERELIEESGLSFVDYRVLITLADASGMHLAMSQLAASLGWSPSRTSHQVKRMEARGLVERITSTADKRSADAYLTDIGLDALKAAVPGQVARVRRYFIDRLAPDQITAMADSYQSLLDYLMTIQDFPMPSRFQSPAE
ncbi:MarR family transcriptional regulator [Mycolicibacterium mucogenicum]|uniref:MarR family transcriptional regulator n=1 Tax=Mycolicibacterium mucogenicum TaxID=56689 RepID=A0A1A3GWH6_MYCMU|nr:MarR family winged helix-turn-helix transcriptional regulator [Mycolicibacterium mucogenicum]OBJ39699.1 MarR family transcriptional regulator [Mycolicibacterium mucogenicum]